MRALSLCALVLWGAQATFAATTFNFSGSFKQDDDVQLFYYTVQNTGLVTVETTSYAGGGFSPILSLFDAAGNFQFDNSGYGSNTEAMLTWNSVAGQQYIIALTQYDNYSIDFALLASGFKEQGMGNFTADLPFNIPTPGGSFLMPGGEQRTANWAVTISSDEPTLTAFQVVPEPGTGLLLVGGVGLLAAWKRARRRT